MVRFLWLLPERGAGIGVLILALAWSLGTALRNWGQIQASGLAPGSSLLLVCVGGLMTVAGIWLGVGAVTWAMGRLMGGKARFFKVLLAISAAAPPLWATALIVGLEAGELMQHPLLLLISATGGLGFIVFLVVALRQVQGLSWGRAAGCTALTALFCASYLSL